MYEQIQNYEHKITFVIGFAGSGKSTHLANLCRENQTVVLTPTHRAADVLRDKGLMNVYTIHSVLKLVPTINMEFRKGQRLQTLRQIGSTDLSHITHIAIDEFSMISQELLDRLLSILPTSAHVYVYGDSTQLPPVDGTPIEPELYTDDIQRLVVQHRADNPEIVETFMRFHHYVESRKEMNLKVGLPRGTLEGFNPETDTILAYTNNRVIELNNIVATQLGLPDNISDGEDVLINGIDCVYHSMTHDTQPNNNMKRPNNNMTHDTQPNKPYKPYKPYNMTTVFPSCVSKGRLLDDDKLCLASKKAQNDIDKFNISIEYPKCYVSIDDETYECYYDIDYHNTSKELKKEVTTIQLALIDYHNLPSDINLKEWCAKNYGAKYVKERNRAWSNYLTHQNYVFDLRRPFATTVHKAQGREFSRVYIDQEDIKKSIKNNYYETYARLMYVALSRAIKEVIII